MTVPAFVRHELEAARAAGVPFDVAWPAALDAIPGAAPGRRAWIVALASTRGEWAGAFTGAPVDGAVGCGSEGRCGRADRGV